MSRLATIVVALFLGLCSPSARAGSIPTSPYSQEAEALRKVLVGKTVNDDDPKWRASLATALHGYCESVLVQVPRNTPEEDRWLNDETQDLRPAFTYDPDHPLSWEKRFERLQNSVESARDGLRRVFSECSSLSGALKGTRQASRASEALLWVRLSALWRAPEEIVRLAEIVGLMSKDARRSSLSDILKGRADHLFDRNSLCNLLLIHAAIVDRAVIPLLEGT
jgi:hypothetical protein